MMQLEKPKPKIQRTYIQAVDADTRKSRSITVYNVTPAQVIKTVKSAAKSRRPRVKASASVGA